MSSDSPNQCPACGQQLPPPPIPDGELRNTIPDSFHIFHATISLCSILMGFVYAALTIVLSSQAELTAARRVLVWCLTITMLLLLSGVVCFHLTAHQVVRYWGIFWPNSLTRTIGDWLFTIGLCSLLVSQAVMLYAGGETVLGIIVAVFAGVFLIVAVAGPPVHARSAPYIRAVGGLPRHPRSGQ